MDPVSIDRATPVWLEATFPRERRFVPAISELVVRIAAICGCGEPEANEFGREVTGAIDRALSGDVTPEGQLDVVVHADAADFDLSVSSRGESLLSLMRPRPD